MAKNFAPYTQLTPFGSGISDDVKYWNEDARRRRAEARQDDQIAYQRRQAENTRKQDLISKVAKNLNNYDTGSKSLNEVQGRLLQQAQKEYIPIIKTLEDPNASDEQKLKAQLKLQNIQQLPDKMKLITDKLTSQFDAYGKLKAEDKIFQDAEGELKFQNGYENIVLDLDESGNPLVAFKDIDGDGINDLMTYDNIIQDKPLFNLQKKFNIDKMADDMAGKVGETDVTEQNGYTSTQVKQAKLDVIDKWADNAMMDANGQPTEVAESEMRKRGLNPDDPNSLKVVRDEFYNNILGRTNKLTSEETDFNASLQRTKYNDGKNDEDPTATIGEPVKPTQNTWGHLYKEIPSGVKSVPVNTELDSFEIGYTTAEGKNESKTLKNPTIKDYSYNTNGELLIVVTYFEAATNNTKESGVDYSDGNRTEINSSVTTKGKQKTERIKTPSRETESEIARKLGFSIEEMRAKAGYTTTGNENKKKISGW